MKYLTKRIRLLILICLCFALSVVLVYQFNDTGFVQPSKFANKIKRYVSFYFEDDVDDSSVSPDRRRVDVVLFSSWVSNAQKERGYRLVLRNWRCWFPFVIPLVFTTDDNVTQSAKAAGWWSLPEVRNPACRGPPLLPPMFLDAKKHFDAKLYGFANADIVFGDTLKPTLELFTSSPGISNKPLLIVGRRTNFEFHSFEKDFLSTDEIQHFTDIYEEAPKSSDYFFTTQDFPWEKIIPLSVGRPAFCRWIMSYARKINATVVDATETIAALHLTTEDGVKSSWHLGGGGMHCNEDVIEKNWSMDVILSLGWVECQVFETYWDANGNVQLRQRNATNPKCPKPYA